MTSNSGRVQTVLGAVAPTDLGVTLAHEHLLWDPVQGSHSPATSASDRGKWNEDIRLDNYYDVRRNYDLYASVQNLVSVDDAIDEVGHFRNAGGDCIVEATPLGVGRDPVGLATIARSTGIKIVMGCGYYVQAFHPPTIASASEEAIAESIAVDVLEGDDATGARAGFIGEIGLSWPPHPDEVKVLRAAARAQQMTGAVMMIHPGRDPKAPSDAIATVIEAGGDPGRVIVAHVERTLFHADEFDALAATGCYLEFDLFGIESSYYPWSPIDMPNDAARVDRIADLFESGYSAQVLLSHDIDMRPRLQKYGGEGYSHILRHVVPVFRRKGFTTEDVHRLLQTNPATALVLT